MSRFILSRFGCIALTSVLFVPAASAQNLLATNAGFEVNTAYYTPGWGFSDGSPEALPGWMITLNRWRWLCRCQHKPAAPRSEGPTSVTSTAARGPLVFLKRF